MSFLKKLAAFLAGGPSAAGDARGLYCYVRCRRCGEIVKARVDLYNDLSAEYDEAGNTARFIYRKALIGRGRCFQPLEVSLAFDARRKLLSGEVSGGEFVSQEEFEASSKAS